MIRFEKVKIGYKEALLKVNFNLLEKGNAYALIGANGSGKSTFLKSVCGQISAFSGEIYLSDRNCSTLSANEKSKIVAFVPSRFPSVSNMRVYDFVGLGRTPYLNALGRLSENDKKHVEASMDELKIKHLGQKMVSELSDGEKQLCSIARAICQETPIVLLDEPTSFLDYRNKLIVLEKINLLASQSQKCVIFSSHDLDLVTTNCKNVLYTHPLNHQLSKIDVPFTKEDLIRLAY